MHYATQSATKANPNSLFTVPSPRQYHYAFWLRHANAMVPSRAKRKTT